MDGCSWLLAVLVVGTMFGYWIVKPVARAPKDPTRPTQFFMSDFLWLLILLYIPMVFLHYAAQWNETLQVLIVGGCLLLSFFYVWWRGVVTLSRLGIHRTSQRAAYLVVVLPVAILSSVMLAILLVIVCDPVSKVRVAWMIAISLLLLIFGARWLCMWVASGAQPRAGMDAQP